MHLQKNVWDSLTRLETHRPTGAISVWFPGSALFAVLWCDERVKFLAETMHLPSSIPPPTPNLPWSECFRRVYKHSHMSSNSRKQIGHSLRFHLKNKWTIRSSLMATTSVSHFFTRAAPSCLHTMCFERTLIWSKSASGLSRNVPASQEWWSFHVFSPPLFLSFPALLNKDEPCQKKRYMMY